MEVAIKNPRSGEVRVLKVGWSWILFLFSGFLGIPLFLRKLNVWGAIFLALWVVNLIGPGLVDKDQAAIISVIMFIVFLGLEIYLGAKGNEMTAKNYLENGWEFADPNSDFTKYAKRRWGLKE